MLEVIYRPKAEDDLTNIANYTSAEWGEQQAKNYVVEIRHKIMFAAEFPGIGASSAGLPTDYRKTPAGSHRIIFRTNERQLIVIRIIHEREDVPDDRDEYW